MTAERDTRLIFTVGHSTRDLHAFIDLLNAHSITHIIDVRTVPRSRHNPQFNGNTLAQALKSGGIGYAHAPGLGGFRRSTAQSQNKAWRNASFRGYADYMQTPAFAEELDRLIGRASTARLALMCAEAVPWRCHRSLIADALTVRGFRVEEIITASRTKTHTLTPFAQVEGKTLTYPAQQDLPASPAD
jgi:uncharacterized protein (DUF488 family)